MDGVAPTSPLHPPAIEQLELWAGRIQCDIVRQQPGSDSGVVVTTAAAAAKRGVLITLADELGLPIKFLGTGERPRDLEPFQPRAYAASLFS